MIWHLVRTENLQYEKKISKKRSHDRKSGVIKKGTGEPKSFFFLVFEHTFKTNFMTSSGIDLSYQFLYQTQCHLVKTEAKCQIDSKRKKAKCIKEAYLLKHNYHQ